MGKILEFIFSKKFYLPIVYIALGFIIYAIACSIINRFMKFKHNKKDKRKETIISLIKNIIKYVIAIIIILAILEVYGINTTTLIASLGVVAFVIGLAFQDIVKDFLSGISIIFDNQYTIGDIVEINGFTGEVIELGLKTTKIKSYTGEVKILSNSSFNEVVNYSLYDSKLLIDINVSYTTDINKLENVLKSLENKILKIENVKGNVEYLGLDKLSDSSLVYRLTLDCISYTHFGVKRKILKLIKETLDKEHIEIPYNKIDVYLKK